MNLIWTQQYQQIKNCHPFILKIHKDKIIKIIKNYLKLYSLIRILNGKWKIKFINPQFSISKIIYYSKITTTQITKQVYKPIYSNIIQLVQMNIKDSASYLGTNKKLRNTLPLNLEYPVYHNPNSLEILNPQSPYYSISPPSKQISLSQPSIPVIKKIKQADQFFLSPLLIDLYEKQSQKVSLRFQKKCNISKVDKQYRKICKISVPVGYYHNGIQLDFSQIIEKSCKIMVKPKIVPLVISLNGSKIKQVYISTLMLTSISPQELLIKLGMSNLIIRGKSIFEYKSNNNLVQVIYPKCNQVYQLSIKCSEFSQSNQYISEKPSYQQDSSFQLSKPLTIQQFKGKHEQSTEQNKKMKESDVWFQVMKIQLRNYFSSEIQQDDSAFKSILDAWMYRSLQQ